VNGLLIEFPVTGEADLALVKNTATLTIINEQLQAKVALGELPDIPAMTNLAASFGATSRTCAVAPISAVCRRPASTNISHSTARGWTAGVDALADDYENAFHSKIIVISRHLRGVSSYPLSGGIRVDQFAIFQRKDVCHSRAFILSIDQL
jgi:hypothetical protein